MRNPILKTISKDLANSETTINYKKKQTTIKPVRNADTNHTKCIRNNPAFQLAGFATILIIILTIATTDTMKTYKEQKEKEKTYTQEQKQQQKEENEKEAKEFTGKIIILTIALITYFGLTPILLAQITRKNEKAREILAKTSNIASLIKEDTWIDLNTEEKGTNWIRINNKIIITQINIIKTQYKLIGKCAKQIQKTETKYIGEPDKEGQQDGWIMIMTFNKKPQGTIKITT